MRKNIKYFILVFSVMSILIGFDLYCSHQALLKQEKQNENIKMQKAIEQKEQANNRVRFNNQNSNEEDDSDGYTDDELNKSFQKTLVYLDENDTPKEKNNNRNSNIAINDFTNNPSDNSNNNNNKQEQQPEYTSANQYYRQKIVNDAKSLLGVPYVFGGTSPTTGFDCSAFVQYVFRMSNIELPRSADTQYERGAPIDKSQLIAGDLVFFQTYTSGASHVGIYIGDDKFIDATSGGVRIESLNSDYRRSCYYGAKRILDV